MSRFSNDHNHTAYVMYDFYDSSSSTRVRSNEEKKYVYLHFVADLALVLNELDHKYEYSMREQYEDNNQAFPDLISSTSPKFEIWS